METEPRPESGEAAEHSAAYVTFTSQAYAAANDDEATRAAVEWLEAQSIHPFLLDVATRSLARLALAEGESVLDVGCGTGVFLPGLAAVVGAQGRVVGLDHSGAFLGEARSALPRRPSPTGSSWSRAMCTRSRSRMRPSTRPTANAS